MITQYISEYVSSWSDDILDQLTIVEGELLMHLYISA